MGYDKVIECTNKIIHELEKNSSRGFASALKDSVQMLKNDEDVEDALDFLLSSATSAKGLQDVYVDGIDAGDWNQLIFDLKHAIEDETF